MKKVLGFTLLELMVVIIIVGVLATLALTQYAQLVERSRGAEARTCMGNIRSLAAAYYLEQGGLAGISAGNVNVGTGADKIPSQCSGQTTHWFSYAISRSGNSLTVTATRCGSNGKPPVSASGGWTQLTTNFATGDDTAAGSGDYN